MPVPVLGFASLARFHHDEARICVLTSSSRREEVSYMPLLSIHGVARARWWLPLGSRIQGLFVLQLRPLASCFFLCRPPSLAPTPCAWLRVQMTRQRDREHGGLP